MDGHDAAPGAVDRGTGTAGTAAGPGSAPTPDEHAAEAAAAAARDAYGRLVAFIAARSHDLAAAQDALGDAFRAALETWPRDGVPASPAAWLLTTARRRLVDAWRHEQVHADALPTLQLIDDGLAHDEPASGLPDQRLELMFVCAHPAIDPAARAPLMLQCVLGLDVARMAAAFVLSPAALGQRLVRAKTKIRAAGIAFEVPPPAQWSERLGDVLEAIYAAYGTAWDDVAGTDPRRSGLAAEALDLAAMVAQALPGEPEPWGLLALLAYCQARAVARRSPAGDYVPLHAQDPSRWDRTLLRQAEAALARASACGRLGPFQLEAAIQSLHTERGLGCPVSPDALRVLYDGLVALHPTLGARVSRACAIGAADGAAAAVAALDVVAAESAREIAAYQPYWAARAHWLTAAGRTADAEAARQRALGLTGDAAVRRFLLRGAG